MSFDCNWFYSFQHSISSRPKSQNVNPKKCTFPLNFWVLTHFWFELNSEIWFQGTLASTNMDISVSHTLPSLSYNSMGWANHKIDFIRTLLLAHGVMVCAIQEHFLLKQNLYKLACFEGFEVFSIPAHKNENVVQGGATFWRPGFILQTGLK